MEDAPEIKNENAKLTINPKIYIFSILAFFSIFSPAILHSNPSELFNALFGSPEAPLSEATVVQINGLYDSIYYFAFFIGLVLGPISDQKGKRKVFILLGGVIFILSSFWTIRSPSIAWLLVFRLFQGIGHILAWQTLMILVFDYSSKENAGRSLSIFFIFIGAAMGLGSMFGGLLADVGVFVPLITSMILYSVVLIGTIFFISDPPFSHKRPSLKESFLLLKQNTTVIVPSIFNFVDRLHMGFLLTLVPLYLTYIIPVAPGIRGMVFGLSALPTIALTYPIGKKSDLSWGRFKPLIVGSIIFGILLSLTGYLSGSSLFVFIIILLLQGFARGVTTAPNKSLLNDLVDSENNATAVAFFNFFGNIGIVFGPLLVYIFRTNYNIAFLVAGLIELGSLGINYVLARKMGFANM